jgi:lipopolysaccharide export LptBFGC system permease protein LptF
MYKNFTAFTCGKHRGRLYKPVLIMKLTLILLTVTFLQVSAATYAQKVTIKVKQTTLKEVFEEIRNQTNYDFLYNSDDIKQAKPVTVELNNATINQVMDLV